MFCQNCGKQIPENVKFCNHCGAAQDSNAAQSTPNTSRAHTPQQRQMNQPTDEKAFKKYVTPYIARNIFIVLCALTIACLFILPPATLIYAITALCFGIPWAVGKNRVGKYISYMQSIGAYEEMLREFAVSKDILDGKVRYSENFIFGKASGSFFRYMDIGWIYRHNVNYILIPIRSEVMIGDNKGNIRRFCKLKLGTREGGEEIKALAALIRDKNPQVLLGFDAAKQSEYKRRTR